MTGSLFPCAYRPFVDFLRNVCSALLPLLKLDYLSFRCKSSFVYSDTRSVSSASPSCLLPGPFLTRRWDVSHWPLSCRDLTSLVPPTMPRWKLRASTSLPIRAGGPFHIAAWEMGTHGKAVMQRVAVYPPPGCTVSLVRTWFMTAHLF